MFIFPFLVFLLNLNIRLLYTQWEWRYIKENVGTFDNNRGISRVIIGNAKTYSDNGDDNYTTAEKDFRIR